MLGSGKVNVEEGTSLQSLGTSNPQDAGIDRSKVTKKVCWNFSNAGLHTPKDQL